jgi:hypothetical protein
MRQTCSDRPGSAWIRRDHDRVRVIAHLARERERVLEGRRLAKDPGVGDDANEGAQDQLALRFRSAQGRSHGGLQGQVATGSACSYAVAGGENHRSGWSGMVPVMRLCLWREPAVRLDAVASPASLEPARGLL